MEVWSSNFEQKITINWAFNGSNVTFKKYVYFLTATIRTIHWKCWLTRMSIPCILRTFNKSFRVTLYEWNSFKNIRIQKNCVFTQWTLNNLIGISCNHWKNGSQNENFDYYSNRQFARKVCFKLVFI